jgi:hypothetical protein
VAFAQPLEQRSLARQHHRVRFAERHPARRVDFGEALQPSAARGPFAFEAVAHHLRRIDILLERERLDHLAAGLPDRAERFERADQRDAQFLLGFASRRGLGVLAFFDEALRDLPSADVLAAPEGTARMDDRYESQSVPALFDNAGDAFIVKTGGSSQLRVYGLQLKQA